MRIKKNPVWNGFRKTTESDKDCEWLVATCKSRLAEEDISGAKAWIFTARSLFPNNFKVQVVTLEHFKQGVSKNTSSSSSQCSFI